MLNFQIDRIRVSKKSWPILCSKLSWTMGPEFLDTQNTQKRKNM